MKKSSKEKNEQLLTDIEQSIGPVTTIQDLDFTVSPWILPTDKRGQFSVTISPNKSTTVSKLSFQSNKRGQFSVTMSPSKPITVSELSFRFLGGNDQGQLISEGFDEIAVSGLGSDWNSTMSGLSNSIILANTNPGTPLTAFTVTFKKVHVNAKTGGATMPVAYRVKATADSPWKKGSLSIIKGSVGKDKPVVENFYANSANTTVCSRVDYNSSVSLRWKVSIPKSITPSPTWILWWGKQPAKTVTVLSNGWGEYPPSNQSLQDPASKQKLDNDELKDETPAASSLALQEDTTFNLEGSWQANGKTKTVQQQWTVDVLKPKIKKLYPVITVNNGVNIEIDEILSGMSGLVKWDAFIPTTLQNQLTWVLYANGNKLQPITVQDGKGQFALTFQQNTMLVLKAFFNGVQLCDQSKLVSVCNVIEEFKLSPNVFTVNMDFENNPDPSDFNLNLSISWQVNKNTSQWQFQKVVIHPMTLKYVGTHSSSNLYTFSSQRPYAWAGQDCTTTLDDQTINNLGAKGTLLNLTLWPCTGYFQLSCSYTYVGKNIKLEYTAFSKAKPLTAKIKFKMRWHLGGDEEKWSGYLININTLDVNDPNAEDHSKDSLLPTFTPASLLQQSCTLKVIPGASDIASSSLQSTSTQHTPGADEASKEQEKPSQSALSSAVGFFVTKAKEAPTETDPQQSQQQLPTKQSTTAETPHSLGM